jgi:hypothetical protein
MTRFAGILTAATLTAWLATAPASAGTWRVGLDANDCPGGCNFHDGTPGGGPGQGIYSAMTDLGVFPGDTVMVWPGEYGRRFVMKSSVTLVSAEGPEFTLIRGSSGSDPAVTLSECSASTVIDGFTFRWGANETSFGGAIGAFVSGGTIKNNIFRLCSGGVGAGVYLQSSTVIVENNVFTANNTEGGGGTISISGGTPIIRSNTFHANTVPFGVEAVDLYSVGSDFTFSHNIVSFSHGGPAIFCAGEQEPEITCNIIWEPEFGAFAGVCGDVLGIDGNEMVNPLICDPGTLDFGVCADSPALNGPCGTIGYVSPTGNCPPCRPTVAEASLDAASWGRVKSRYRQ